MSKIQDPKLAELVKQLHAQDNTEISADATSMDAILSVYSPATMKAMSEQLPVADPEMDKLIRTILAEWKNVNETRSMSAFFNHLNKMGEALDVLVSYHPDYDHEDSTL